MTIETPVISSNGFAIGPLLLAVALLAILATSIAAGSSSFTSNTSEEQNRINAAALLAIGQSLKLATDRVAGTGIALASVTTTGAVAASDIFSTSGGGLTPPSTSLAATPATDTWVYSWAPVTSIGTSAADKVAFLSVTAGVCNQINKIIGGPVTPTAFAPSPATWLTGPANMSNWDAGTGAGTLDGKLTGCIQTTTSSAGTYYYQVLGAQ